MSDKDLTLMECGHARRFQRTIEQSSGGDHAYVAVCSECERIEKVETIVAPRTRTREELKRETDEILAQLGEEDRLKSKIVELERRLKESERNHTAELENRAIDYGNELGIMQRQRDDALAKLSDTKAKLEEALRSAKEERTRLTNKIIKLKNQLNKATPVTVLQMFRNLVRVLANDTLEHGLCKSCKEQARAILDAERSL